MSFFIDKYLPKTKNGDPCVSTITIVLPDSEHPNSSGRIKGLIENDVSVTLGNSFGPLVPDLTTLQDFFMLADIKTIPSWIGASAQTWKGTNPIAFSTDMYLINWSPDLNYEGELKDLGAFCTLTQSGSSNFMVKVHGGYQPNFLSNNNQFFNMGAFTQKVEENEADYAEAGEALSGQLSQIQQNIENGTLTVLIGSRFKLANLLLTRLDISPSVVEVYNPYVGGKPKPLYYRVGMSFQTARAALSTDLGGMLGG